MSRPDPALFDPARYPLVSEITTRFADIDANRHLNNVAIAAILEESRAQLVLRTGQAMTMVVHVSIDYLDQAFYPQPVTACLAVESLGRTTWNAVQILLQQGRPFAFSRATAVNAVAGKPEPLTDAMREVLLGYGLRHG